MRARNLGTCCSDRASNTSLLKGKNRKQSYLSIKDDNGEESLEVRNNYIKHCTEDIGWYMVSTTDVDKINEWMVYISEKVHQNTCQQTYNMNRIYFVMYESKQDRDYCKDMLTLLIHTRIFQIQTIIASSKAEPNFDEERSSQYLLKIFKKPNYKYIYRFKEHKYLLEFMMDILEDLSTHYRPNESVHEYIDAIISFVAYYNIVEGHKYERDLSFLESYLCIENTVKVWAAVLLSSSKSCFTYLQIMTQYVTKYFMDYESLKDYSVPDDVLIVYMAVLNNASHNDLQYSISDIDYKSIEALRKWNSLSVFDHELINNSILKIFNKSHKAGVLKNIADNDVYQSEIMKLSIDCFCMALQYGTISDDNIIVLLLFLDELFTCSTNNTIFLRLVDVIVHHLYLYKRHPSLTIRNKLCDTILKLWTNQNFGKEIYMLSLLIVIHNVDSASNLTDVANVFNNLCDIILGLYYQQSKIPDILDLKNQDETDAKQIIRLSNVSGANDVFNIDPKFPEQAYLSEIFKQINKLKISYSSTVNDLAGLEQSYLSDSDRHFNVKMSHVLEIHKNLDFCDNIQRKYKKLSNRFLGFTVPEIVDALSKI